MRIREVGSQISKWILEFTCIVVTQSRYHAGSGMACLWFILLRLHQALGSHDDGHCIHSLRRTWCVSPTADFVQNSIHFFGQLIHAQFHHRKALACCQRRIWHNCHATLSLFPWTRSQRRHRHHGLRSEARCKKGGDLNIEAADHSMRVCSKPCLKVSFTPWCPLPQKGPSVESDNMAHTQVHIPRHQSFCLQPMPLADSPIPLGRGHIPHT